MHLRPRSPSCSQILVDSSSFDIVRASYISSINGLGFNTSTPLARSLLNIGFYFTSSDTVYRSMFGFGSSYMYPSSYRNASLSSQGRSVCWGCQNSTVVIISDGEPVTDSLSSLIAARLRTLNGGPVYCPDSMPCGSLTQPDKGYNPAPTATSDDNPNYLLDDVAKVLFEQDLQHNSPPVVGDFDTRGKQSLRISTIAFGTPSNLLRNTAEVGGGLYYTAEDAPTLRYALEEILSAQSVPSRTSAFAPAAVDSQLVNGSAGALITRLKPSPKRTQPWQGFLYRFQLAQERLIGCSPNYPWGGGDLNNDGDCNDTHLVDADGDAVVESPSGGFVKLLSPLTPAQHFWEAGEQLKPSPSPTTRWQTRKIFTIIDTNGDGKIDRQDTPVEFHEGNAAALREYLGLSQNPNGCADLATRLGVPSLSPDECARLIIRWYRGADALHPDPAMRDYDRPFLLHDLFHSAPISVEPPQPKPSCGFSNQCLPALFRGHTPLQDGYPAQYTFVDAYDKYVYEAGDRDKVVLVGSNGGMLHAFLNGRSLWVDPTTGQPVYDAGTGQELWAFIPPDLLPKLRPHLGQHGYFVDGTPMVRDVWIDGADGQPADGAKQWQEYRTVAVVGTGRGGVHRFALDLTRVLGLEPGSTIGTVPNQPGDFLWMWPQPCDPLALKVGESFSNFAPQPPPIGPVALSPMADDALRWMYGQGGGASPWIIDDMPARERWVVALNGGYDPHQTRGRGMALVDIASGHTVWSFFHHDGKSRSEHLRYSIAAGVALTDVGHSQITGVDQDDLFDTATVGDYGGQLWTVRFWRPGEWDFATQQVSNWYAARSFRVENLGGWTSHPEALRGPFSTTAANVIQPDTGVMRTFIGTGDSQNLYELGTSCRLGNPRACAEQGCSTHSLLEIRRGGSMAAASGTHYSGYALDAAESFQGYAGPSCSSTQVRLSWDIDPSSSCTTSNNGSIEAVCDGDPYNWSCQTFNDAWMPFNSNPSYPAFPQRFYGLWSYGGTPQRTFNTDSEAYNFDWQMLTDTDLVNVGQFGFDGNVVHPQEDASPHSMGWYLPYASLEERTGSAATVIDGCVLWNPFEPSPVISACSSLGKNSSRLYQADFVSGRASCALGFYTPESGNWARFHRFATHVSLSQPAPQRTEFNAEVHTRATLSTPLGSVPVSPPNEGTPVFSLPITEGPP